MKGGLLITRNSSAANELCNHFSVQVTSPLQAFRCPCVFLDAIIAHKDAVVESLVKEQISLGAFLQRNQLFAGNVHVSAVKFLISKIVHWAVLSHGDHAEGGETVLSDVQYTAIASLSAWHLRCLQRPPSFECRRNYPPADLEVRVFPRKE